MPVNASLHARLAEMGASGTGLSAIMAACPPAATGAHDEPARDRPESPLPCPARSRQELLVVLLRPQQDPAVLRWLAPRHRSQPGRVQGQRQRHGVLLRLQAQRQGFAVRRQPPEAV